MPQNKYQYHDWDEYFRGHNVLNCNAADQQSGPCQKVANKVNRTKCMSECKDVLKRLSDREAMRERWLSKISEHATRNAHYERWEPWERKHLKAFICRDQPECKNRHHPECKMCEQVVRETQKEYNERVRTINKLGGFRGPRTFGK